MLYEYALRGSTFFPATLYLTSAPLSGTGITTTAKFGVVTKSPLNAFIGDSPPPAILLLEPQRPRADAIVLTAKMRRCRRLIS